MPRGRGYFYIAKVFYRPMLVIALNFLIAVLFLYLLANNLYYLLFGAASAFAGRKTTRLVSEKRHRIAIFIPAYKEDGVIVSVARKALEQDYPQEHFTVAVIADSLQEETLAKLRELPIETVVVSFEKSTKSKALREGMKALGDDYDIALILDADNIMAPDFLSKVNQAFADGYEVVQGHRTAKNLDTHYAVLDAASEEINNSLFRKGHRALGLSSGLIGSGMAFRYALFKDFMSTVHAVGGFDKELELKLNRDKVTIEYLNDAFVYDEKVQNKEIFEQQRRRWLSAQMVYLRRFFFKAVGELFRSGNIGFFDKAWQMTQPPRVIALGGTAFLWLLSGLLSLTLGNISGLNFMRFDYWSINFAAIVLALAFALPRRMYNAKLLRAVGALPQAIVTMFMLLFKLKGANDKYIHTKHQHVDEDLPKV